MCGRKFDGYEFIRSMPMYKYSWVSNCNPHSLFTESICSFWDQIREELRCCCCSIHKELLMTRLLAWEILLGLHLFAIDKSFTPRAPTTWRSRIYRKQNIRNNFHINCVHLKICRKEFGYFFLFFSGYFFSIFITQKMRIFFFGHHKARKQNIFRHFL